MSYIYPKPGVAGVEATLTLFVAGEAGDTGLSVPSMQDITVQADNDVFTWTQLDIGSKKQIATTATNSVSLNVVLDQEAFFGNAGANANTASNVGIFGLSNDKTLVEFDLFFGNTDAGEAGKTLSGNAYVTGLSPTVSADSPVWVSPVTLTVDGDYTVA